MKYDGKCMVFDIKRFSINDGPGIRTTVFFKGCPLSCVWCHNPESVNYAKQLSFNMEKCISCMRCVSVCNCHCITDGQHKVDFSNCTGCGNCVKECPKQALEMIGRLDSIKDILDVVLRDKPFYDKTGGGITMSGGEPLAHADFAIELLRESKLAGLHTCVETSGFARTETILKFVTNTDIFLYDIKHTDPQLHKYYTGVDNRLILQNLSEVDKAGAQIILRCPIIPKVNDNVDHFKKIGAITESLLNVIQINVIPYHSLGVIKRMNIGCEISQLKAETPNNDVIQGWCKRISEFTDVPVVQA